MKKSKTILFLIKFGEKEHLESLMNKGELFFNTTLSYNEIEKNNKEQGDEYEGSVLVENLDIANVKLNHPTLGNFNFNPVPGEKFKYIEFNHNYINCSFYAITKEDLQHSDTFKINEKMLEFGDYALFITNPNKFLNNLFETLKNEKITFESNFVRYKDLTSEKRIKMTPFIKKQSHSYQNEIRIVLKNKLTKQIIQLESLSEYSELVPSKLIESEFNILKK